MINQLKEILKNNGDTLDDVVRSCFDFYDSERALNELRKGIVSEIEYLKRDNELSSLFIDILTLQEIKLKRKYGRKEDY